MDEAKRELVRAWLIKSRHDLETARQISMLPDGHLDAAIYHCQQAAEKALKGFLAFHDHELERTHDLKRLVQMASSDDRTFLQWKEAAIMLTPSPNPCSRIRRVSREANEGSEGKQRPRQQQPFTVW